MKDVRAALLDIEKPPANARRGKFTTVIRLFDEIATCPPTYVSKGMETEVRRVLLEIEKEDDT